MSDTLTIRPLATIEEYEKATDVQRRAWSMHDLSDAVPPHVLLTAQKNGGLCAGAFDEHGEMIGFIFGFLGQASDGRLKHCSHMMGIIPDGQRKNTGYRIKLFQRQYVQKQGFDLITWTYDPLEGLNANLNIAKLGSIVHKYHHNLYGDSLGGLNRGLPTDRFEVEWWINSPRVRHFVEQSGDQGDGSNRMRPSLTQLQHEGATYALRAEFDELNVPQPHRFQSHAEKLLVEIPPDFQFIKQVAPDVARLWRHETAMLFSHAFHDGYAVTDFIRHEDGERRRNYYLMEKHLTHEA